MNPECYRYRSNRNIIPSYVIPETKEQMEIGLANVREKIVKLRIEEKLLLEKMSFFTEVN